MFMSFDAQALLMMLMRKVDKSGRLALGRNGLSAIPILIGHPDESNRVGNAVTALIEDGCVKIEGDNLLIVNFEQAQESKTSNAEKQRRFREVHKKSNRALPEVTARNHKREEREEREENLTTLSSSSTGVVLPLLAPPEKPRTPTASEQVFDHWRKVHNHPKALFDRKRRQAVEGRLKDGYTIERLKRAVEGCRLSPHHMGENDRNTSYNDLELICRNSVNVEKFELLCPAPLAAGPPPKPKRTSADVEEEVNREFDEANHGGV